MSKSTSGSQNTGESLLGRRAMWIQNYTAADSNMTQCKTSAVRVSVQKRERCARVCVCLPLLARGCVRVHEYVRVRKVRVCVDECKSGSVIAREQCESVPVSLLARVHAVLMVCLQ